MLRFFQRSRDKWKVKCLAAKARLKRLQQRLGYLEQSKHVWKARAQPREAELAVLRERLEQTEAVLEGLKKKGRSPAN